MWFSAQDRIAVSVKPPGKEWIGPIEPCEFIENRIIEDGTVLSVYNEVYHPANGHNYISLYLSPFFSATEIVGVRRARGWCGYTRGRFAMDDSTRGSSAMTRSNLAVSLNGKHGRFRHSSR